ncbi:hypothetical protein BCS96_01090 [Vibrio breoganii]|nr:hypothetical protein BCU79_13620 [Vibrio breoganii]PMK67894.1 hypothetical protein BCT94_02470 [Vibrio breoganii]PML36950.1 hypothetical protein BCT78_08875 [Vibrio breoganii]PMO93773.1 hypothetical protein BCS98_07230 [Vibrio breoganii]PMP00081.1 hypothetical protein BCS96_01090 [Vibrio breoganii]
MLNEVIPECFYLESRNEGASRPSIRDLEGDELTASDVLNEVIPECFYLESRNEGACRSSIGDLEGDELVFSDLLSELRHSRVLLSGI